MCCKIMHKEKIAFFVIETIADIKIIEIIDIEIVNLHSPTPPHAHTSQPRPSTHQ